VVGLTFLTGIGLGLAVAMPVGPIGVLCIQRGLAGGFPAALSTGLGAAAADAVYGCVAAFGLGAALALFDDLALPLRVGGGVLLLALAARIAWRARRPRDAAPPATAAAANFATTFGLTLANPATILSFVAIFAAAGLGDLAVPGQAAALIFGVFAGSALWWLLLSGGVALIRDRLPHGALALVDWLSAAILAGFALVVLSAQ